MIQIRIGKPLICNVLWAYVASANFHHFKGHWQIPLHIPDGRQMPAVRAARRPWKSLQYYGMRRKMNGCGTNMSYDNKQYKGILRNLVYLGLSMDKYIHSFLWLIIIHPCPTKLLLNSCQPITRYAWVIELTHLPLVPHICDSELGQHWFR